MLKLAVDVAVVVGYVFMSVVTFWVGSYVKYLFDTEKEVRNNGFTLEDWLNSEVPDTLFGRRGQAVFRSIIWPIYIPISLAFLAFFGMIKLFSLPFKKMFGITKRKDSLKSDQTNPYNSPEFK